MRHVLGAMLITSLFFLLPGIAGVIDCYYYFWFGETLLKSWDGGNITIAYIMGAIGTAIGAGSFIFWSEFGGK